jgi:hypothetical protein
MVILSGLAGQWLTGDWAVTERHALPALGFCDLADEAKMRIFRNTDIDR